MKIHLTKGKLQWLLSQFMSLSAPPIFLAKKVFTVSFVFVLLFCANQLSGQTIARQVIGIAGGSANTSFGQVSYTVGETFIGTSHSSTQNETITAGFQQPTISFLPDYVDPVFSINIFPNPTQDLLQVTLWDATQKQLSMSLTNIKGQVLIPNLLINPWKNEIDLTPFPAGAYFLKVTDENKQSKSYKILKTK